MASAPASPLVRSILPVVLALGGCATPHGTAAGSATSSSLSEGPHEVVLNGVRHWYRVAGNARAGAAPVVFLHGGPGQGSVHFAELVGPGLEPSLRMVYFDQRGSGRSERPASGEYTLPLLVEDLEQLRLALGVPKLSLIGQSFGGTLALEYAARYPERVERLVFVSGLWDTPMQCRLRLQTLAQLRPEAYARVRADTLRDDGTRRGDCDLEFAAFASGEEREDYNTEMMYPDPAVRARLEEVEAAHGYRNTGEMGGALFRGGLLTYRFAGHERLTMPVLVIAGRHDGAARPEGLRALADLLPRARFLEYERSGHFVYLDEPERFARDVIGFLNEASG
jgi:proline iminopeptidase